MLNKILMGNNGAAESLRKDACLQGFYLKILKCKYRQDNESVIQEIDN